MTKATRCKTLLIHIGDPKTGSSSIQRALFDGNWSSTGSSSIAYPERLNEIPLAKSLYADAAAPQRAQKFAATAQWLDQQHAEVAVLSAEHFAFVQPQALQDAVAQYLPDYADRVRVLAYVRPHLSRLLSSYAQRVKTRGLQQNFETFCKASIRQERFQYTRRFLAWQEVFGAAFALRPFIRSQLHQGDVVADFLQQTLGDGAGEIETGTQVNDSPGLDQLACLQLVQKVLRNADVEQPLRHALCGTLAQQLASKAPAAGGRLKMHSDLVPLLQEYYRQDAQALDAAFFTGSPLTSALEQAAAEAVSTPQSIAAADRFSPQQLASLRSAARSLASQVQDAPGEWQRHLRLSKRRKRNALRETSPTVTRIYSLLDDITAAVS